MPIASNIFHCRNSLLRPLSSSSVSYGFLFAWAIPGDRLFGLGKRFKGSPFFLDFFRACYACKALFNRKTFNTRMATTEKEQEVPSQCY